jgi:hypothetical protein
MKRKKTDEKSGKGINISLSVHCPGEWNGKIVK